MQKICNANRAFSIGKRRVEGEIDGKLAGNLAEKFGGGIKNGCVPEEAQPTSNQKTMFYKQSSSFGGGLPTPHSRHWR